MKKIDISKLKDEEIEKEFSGDVARGIIKIRKAKKKDED